MSELKFTDQEEPNLPSGEDPVLVEDQDELTSVGHKKHMSLEPGDVRGFYTSLFFDMFVESLDIDMAFEEAKETFVEALVTKGIQVNADQALAVLGLMKDRAIRVASLKRMVTAMGLHNEYDRLLDLELTYFASKMNQGGGKTTKIVHPVAQGESKDA